MLVGDSAFLAFLLLDALPCSGVTAITRLRLDPALYDPATFAQRRQRHVARVGSSYEDRFTQAIGDYIVDTYESRE